MCPRIISAYRQLEKCTRMMPEVLFAIRKKKKKIAFIWWMWKFVSGTLIIEEINRLKLLESL